MTSAHSPPRRSRRPLPQPDGCDSTVVGIVQRCIDCTRRHRFTRDILLVLIVKIALLSALKYAFFNQPQAPGMTLPAADVAHALLAPAPVAPDTSNHTDHQGNHHAR